MSARGIGLVLCVSAAACSSHCTVPAAQFVRIVAEVFPLASPTREIFVRVRGIAMEAGSTMRVDGPAYSVTAVAAEDRSFEAYPPLVPNRLNRLFVTEIFADGREGPPAPLEVVQDSSPPRVQIDFPVDGEERLGEFVAVGGRVSDLLSGTLGVEVTVNGLIAAVEMGSGTNGGFLLPDLPLEAEGPTVIDVVATDAAGNSVAAAVTIGRLVPTGPYLEIASGDGQGAVAGEMLFDPIAVRVSNLDGTPFAGKVVTIKVTRSDGRLSADAGGEGAMTFQAHADDEGIARAFWRLGSDAGQGNNRVRATSTGVQGTVVFGAAGLAGRASQINVSSGMGQRGEAGAPLAERLRVFVTDGANGVEGVPVTYFVTRGGGFLDAPGAPTGRLVRVLTDRTGHAYAQLTLGPESGNNEVEATFAGNAGSPAVFIAFGVKRDPKRATSFSGIVMNNAFQPIEGARCILRVRSARRETLSGPQGQFRFDDIADSGSGLLRVEGAVATGAGGAAVPAGTFPALSYETVIVPNADNSLSTPVLLPPMNPANNVEFDNTADAVLTMEGVEGFRMLVRAGSMTLADGRKPAPGDPATLSVNMVHSDDVPMPMPDGIVPPLAWTLQPAGALFDPPVEVSYPNVNGLPPGAATNFLSFDHDTGRFEVVATGRIDTEGALAVTDPGSGIERAGWGGIQAPPPVTGDCENCSVSIGESHLAQITIEGPRRACVGQTWIYKATSFIPGGAFVWNHGVPFPLAGPSAQAITFDQPGKWCIQVSYACPGITGASTDTAYVDVADSAYVIQATVRAGDVVEVDLKELPLEDLEFVDEDEDAGFVAQVLDATGRTHGDILRTEKRFYIVPKLSEVLHPAPDTPECPALQPAAARGTLRLRGRCSGALVPVDVLFDVVEGASSFNLARTVGPGAPPGRLVDTFRVQQRLRWLGFVGKKLNQAAPPRPIPVDGIVAGGVNLVTEEAIRLFNAAVSADGRGNPGDAVADAVDGTGNVLGEVRPGSSSLTWLNAVNAPRWECLGISRRAGLINHEIWATSWALQIIEGAILARPALLGIRGNVDFRCTSLTEYPERFGTPHDEHRAGLTIDWELDDNALQGTSAPGFGVPGPPGPGGALLLLAAEEALVEDILAIHAAAGAAWRGVLVGGGMPAVNDYPRIHAELIRRGIPDTEITAVSSHWNHFHVRLQPPGIGVPRPILEKVRYLPPLVGVASSQLQADAADVMVQLTGTGPVALDSHWILSANGQAAAPDADGHFRIPNLSAADNFGAGGPGTPSDRESDDYVVVTGLSQVDGAVRYALSERFRIRHGQTYLVGSVRFSDTPPSLPSAVKLASDRGVLQIGEAAQLTATVLYEDGTEEDVTAASTTTTYRVSNSRIAGVDANGVVTGLARGTAFVTATHLGVSAVLRVLVTAAQVVNRTTVEGFVRLEDGTPVAGAAVSTNLGGQAVSGGDGAFSLQVDVPEGAPVIVLVSVSIAGVVYTGSLQLATIVAGGITDAGIIVPGPTLEGIFSDSAAVELLLGSVGVLGSGDVDGDGDGDLVAIQGQNLVVVPNLGGGLFGAPADYTTGGSQTSLSLADMDGDGDLDAVTAGAGISVNLNRGDGTLLDGVAYLPAASCSGVAIGDADADGDLDVFTRVVDNATFSAGEVALFPNDGTGRLGSETRITAGTTPTFYRSLAAADLDGDGDADVVVSNYFAGEILAFLSKGDGTFAAPVRRAITQPISLSVAELNSDQRPDLLVSRGATVEIFFGNGNGTFAAGPAFTPARTAFWPAIGDLDGDGDGDLLCSESIYFEVLRNAGNGAVVDQIAYLASAGGAPALIDADGDGDSDVALPNSLGVRILLNRGGGLLDATRSFATGLDPRAVVLGDMDADSDLDLGVTTAGSGDHRMCVLRNRGDAVCEPQVKYPVGFSPHSAAAGDLDGDGDLDLATASSSLNTVSILRNNGTGTYTVLSPLAVGTTPNAIVLADFDGDGDRDLATANRGSSNLSVRLNNGNATFAAQTLLAAGATPLSLAAGDIDLDGDIDLVAACQGAQAIEVAYFLNAGSGVFLPAVRDAIASTSGSPTLALGDLDRDGAPDIALRDNVGLRTLLNSGDGTFALTSTRTGSFRDALALGDLDGDGAIDIVATGNYEILALRNNGDGSFSEPVHFGLGAEFPQGLALGDLDADGDLDLACSVQSNTVCVILNRRIQ